MKQVRSYLALLLILTMLPMLQAQPGAGSFSFTLKGYTVVGQLVNATIHADKSVTLRMVVDDTLQTFVGGVPINGTGDWEGTVNGTVLTGTIANVSGTLQACIFFFCGQADYVGNGTWTGTLTGSQGSGTFRGVITFTRSSLPQIPVNQSIPVSGSWSSTFQTSS
jgi:hypothetical protein